MLLLGVIKKLQKYFHNEKIREQPRYYNMILMLIPLGSMIVVHGSFLMGIRIQKSEFLLYSIIIFFIMLFINVLVFTIYWKLSEDMELRRINAVYEQQITMYSKYLEDNENSILEFQRLRHDLKNHMIYVLELSEKGERKELEKELTRLTEKEPFERRILSKTNNMAIDSIINYKYTIAMKYGIDFSIDLKIPQELPFKSTDLCIILGNALDNSLEATIMLKADKRYIKVFMRMDMQNLIMIVRNSFDGKIKQNAEGKIQTRKDDSFNHGFGLGAIQSAANRYHGCVITTNHVNEFCLKVVLYAD